MLLFFITAFLSGEIYFSDCRSVLLPSKFLPSPSSFFFFSYPSVRSRCAATLKTGCTLLSLTSYFSKNGDTNDCNDGDDGVGNRRRGRKGNTQLLKKGVLPTQKKIQLGVKRSREKKGAL